MPTNLRNGHARRPLLANLLAAHLRLSGFRPGLPHGLTRASIRADRASCRCLRCPVCRRRGLAYLPYTDRGRQSYRVLAMCICGAAEEL
jgi:hypothetical protein